VHDDSCDITPLLMSFLLSEGPNVQGAVGIGHLGVVIGDVTDLSSMASSVENVALLFKMPHSITEQALINVRTLVCEMAGLPAPEAVHVVFIRAMLPPICEVVEPHVKYCLRNICHCWGVMEDAWLKAMEGIGSSQGVQGVVFLPPDIIILFLDLSQLLGQVSNFVMCVPEALYLGVEGFIPFLLDGEVDHRGEHLCRVEGISFLLHENPSRVWVFSCSEWTRVLKAITTP
jgi:hypothetical protein